MSDYASVKNAMAAGTPPELICGTCPWDRLCITPPTMTQADIDKLTREAEVKDANRPDAENEMPVGLLLTTLMLAGKDTAAQLCPIFSLRLRSPEGRQVADLVRRSMRGEES